MTRQTLVVVGLAWRRWIDLSSLATMPADAIWSIAVFALFNTTLTQFLWIGDLAATPDVTRSAYLFFLKPVVATALTLIVVPVVYQTVEFARIRVTSGFGRPKALPEA
jgi:CBS-domain-containing membrane protein